MNFIIRIFLSVLFIALVYTSCTSTDKNTESVQKNNEDKDTLYTPPDTNNIPDDEFGEMVRYGKELINNTAYYIGPNGIKGKYLGNKMNCGNCHLDAGTRPYGLNYFSSHARYPQYRARENRILTLAERINNCVERPHNGKPLPLDSKEIVAMTCYMKWLSTNIPTGQRVPGDDGIELVYPNRAADCNKGRAIYQQHCQECHGKNGEGLMDPFGVTYSYPPLWGKDAYQKGSSMHRVLKAARFIKANMPNLKATWKKPFLTDEEAIDVAAFINNDSLHDRPITPVVGYPNINVKSIDYDEGPYTDTFSAYQHKYGPYQPIIDYRKKNGLPVKFRHSDQ